MDFAEVDEFYGKDLFRKSNHPRIDNPLVLQSHWPREVSVAGPGATARRVAALCAR